MAAFEVQVLVSCRPALRAKAQTWIDKLLDEVIEADTDRPRGVTVTLSPTTTGGPFELQLTAAGTAALLTKAQAWIDRVLAEVDARNPDRPAGVTISVTYVNRAGTVAATETR